MLGYDSPWWVLDEVIYVSHTLYYIVSNKIRSDDLWEVVH